MWVNDDIFFRHWQCGDLLSDILLPCNFSTVKVCFCFYNYDLARGQYGKSCFLQPVTFSLIIQSLPEPIISVVVVIILCKFSSQCGFVKKRVSIRLSLHPPGPSPPSLLQSQDRLILVQSIMIPYCCYSVRESAWSSVGSRSPYRLAQMSFDIFLLVVNTCLK